MSETTADPTAVDVPTPPEAVAAATADAATSGDAAAAEAPAEPRTTTIRGLLEAGAHFGHQTRRWNPRMRDYIFGERNGIHILDLDQTLPMFKQAIDFVRETVADGGIVLFVGTKRQAAPSMQTEAQRSQQFYVNNRWLGGMLTNWKTVKKSIERYKQLIEILDDEEKRGEHSKKELAAMSRQRDKYQKSLEGIRDMPRQPDAMFVIDVMQEQIAVSEGQRLGIPIIAIVDSNCDPRGIDYVVPANDDALRAIDYYATRVADACVEGKQIHQERIQSQPSQDAQAGEGAGGASGRRVVEIKQPPRRSRGASGRTASAGGWGEREEQPAEGAPPAQAAAPAAAAKPAEADAPAAEAASAEPEAAKTTTEGDGES